MGSRITEILTLVLAFVASIFGRKPKSSSGTNMKKEIAEKDAIVAYKAFEPNWTCRGFKFKIGKTYTHDGPVRMCNSGFHACAQAQHCFSYYDFNPKNKIAEVLMWGTVETHDEDSKVCASNIKIVREIEWAEVLRLANTGVDNTGHSNSGYRNSGDRNSGYRNSGYRNSGDRNSGDRNSGYRNSGYRNSGYRNSGDRNSGDSNSGSWNSGDSNSGDSNSGSWNSGDSNSGDSNSGSWNSGSRNSGDSNSGYRNSGAFCTDPNPEVWLFDQPSGIKVQDWERHPSVQLLNSHLESHIWIYANSMSDAEKEANPNWETRDGYLKAIDLKEAWANMWGNLTDTSKQVFIDLPNFDSKKFKEITGIDVNLKVKRTKKTSKK
jgi:hypothetical protein